MTMHVNLSPEMEVFIRNKVASGFYGNATEVIRDAIRRMQAEEARVAAWQAAIKIGDEQLDRGEGVPYTADALKGITQRAVSAMRSGKTMDRMSSREDVPVTLSPRAQQDFIDILQYTGEIWGEAQLLAYRDKIDGALKAIGRNPQIGHWRSDLPTTHLAYLVGSHVIVYRVRTSGIGVVRILHQRMSIGRHV